MIYILFQKYADVQYINKEKYTEYAGSIVYENKACLIII